MIKEHTDSTVENRSAMEDRRMAAACALAAHKRAKHEPINQVEMEEAITDLLTDTLHYADYQEINITDLVQRVLDHYEAEGGS